MRLRLLTAFAFALILSSTIALVEGAPDLRFAVTFSSAQSATPLDGRVLLMVSTNDAAEPRFQIADGPNTQAIFGIDVDGLKPEPTRSSTHRRSGIRSTASRRSQPGKYYVQALLHQVPDVPPSPTATWSSCRWIAAKASSGRGRPESLQHAAADRDRPSEGRNDHGRARQGHPADR